MHSNEECGILATVMTSIITKADRACKCTPYLELHLIEEIILCTSGSIFNVQIFNGAGLESRQMLSDFSIDGGQE